MEFQSPIHQVAQTCKPVVHTVTHTVQHLVGVTWMHASMACVISAIAAAGLAYLYMNRSAIKSSISNAKTSVETSAETAIASFEAKL